MENSPDSANLTLEVTIPENSVAGDKITIQCPDSNYVEFVAPPNISPGDTVHVMVTDSEESQISCELKEGQRDILERPKAKSGGLQGVAAVTTVRLLYQQTKPPPPYTNFI